MNLFSMVRMWAPIVVVGFVTNASLDLEDPDIVFYIRAAFFTSVACCICVALLIL